MPGFMPGIHVLIASPIKDVDGRNKSGHDVDRVSTTPTLRMRPAALRHSKPKGVAIFACRSFTNVSASDHSLPDPGACWVRRSLMTRKTWGFVAGLALLFAVH